MYFVLPAYIYELYLNYLYDRQVQQLTESEEMTVDHATATRPPQRMRAPKTSDGDT